MKRTVFLTIVLLFFVNSFSLTKTKQIIDFNKYHLYFPLAFHDSQYTSYIGLINFTPDTVNYIIHIIKNTGDRMVDDITGVLEPGQRIYREICEQELDEPCWVMVSSNNFVAGYMNTVSNDLQESYFYLPDTSLSKTIYVPHIAPETDYWDTYTSVIDGDFSDICNPYFDDFSNVRILTGPVQPLEQNYFNWLTDIYGGTFPESMKGWGKIYTTGNSTISGIETFKFKPEGYYNTAGLSLPGELSDILYFPHIHVEGDYWWTGIAVNNASDSKITVTFHAMASDGSELSTVDWDIDSYEKLVKLAQNIWTDKEKEFPEDTAWIKATCDEKKIIGYELFGTLESHGRKLLAGVNCPMEGNKELVFPHVESSQDFWTGIAFVNISGNNAKVSATAYNDEGKQLGSVTISDAFKPNEKYVATVKDLFNGNVPEGTTYLIVSSTENIVGFELWGNLTPEQDYMSGVLAIPHNYIVFKEDFENELSKNSWRIVIAKDNQYSLSGWKISSLLSLGLNTWSQQYPQIPPEGNNYAVGFYGTSNALNHQYLLSPQIDLPDTASILSYFYQFGWPSTAVNSCNVYITEDLTVTDGIDFTKTTLVKEYTPSFIKSLDKLSEIPDFTVWNKETIDISQFAGKKVRIIFEINSKFQQSFHIDNLVVR